MFSATGCNWLQLGATGYCMDGGLPKRQERASFSKPAKEEAKLVTRFWHVFKHLGMMIAKGCDRVCQGKSTEGVAEVAVISAANRLVENASHIFHAGTIAEGVGQLRSYPNLNFLADE
jgi:hypothetical protein